MTHEQTGWRIAVALNGAGWHPAAWREPAARPTELCTPAYWRDLAQHADRGLVDFVTIEDALQLQSDSPMLSDRRTDQVRGQLDALLIAARIAPTTSRLGFLPTAITTHTEPFHVSKAVATLDFVSHGRAGVRVQIAPRADTARHFGRRDDGIADLRTAAFLPGDDDPGWAQVADFLDEAADYVAVLRGLWDSWEDDAEIRDIATGRFVDRNRLHAIDFAGRWFSVKGPSITPRPPQGQPIVAALGHGGPAYRLIATSADVGFVTPHSAADAGPIVEQIRSAEQAAGRTGDPAQVFADLVVVLDPDAAAARARKQRLDDWSGAEFRSDASVFVGTPTELVDHLMEWRPAGLAGFRLRPAALPHDLAQITDGVIPQLRRRGALAPDVEPDRPGRATLRDRLGLARPRNRFAA